MYRRKIESEHRGTDPLCDDCDALCRASNLRSLREVCLGFAANATRMNHLGIDHMICRTTLSDANNDASPVSSVPYIVCFTAAMLLFYRTAIIQNTEIQFSEGWGI